VYGQMSRNAHCPQAMYEGRAGNSRRRTAADTSAIFSSVRAACGFAGFRAPRNTSLLDGNTARLESRPFSRKAR